MHASTSYVMHVVGGLEEELHRSTDNIKARNAGVGERDASLRSMDDIRRAIYADGERCSYRNRWYDASDEGDERPNLWRRKWGGKVGK